jgi:hypothetical protein
MSRILLSALVFLVLQVCSLCSYVLAAPVITAATGTINHGESLVIGGTDFGSKPTPVPVAWDTLEDGTCNTTATAGSWSSVNNLVISTDHQRSSVSTYNAGINFTGEATGAFTGGSDSPVWYIQYWFYLDSDFSFSSEINNNLGNIKILRLWSTGDTLNNLRVQLLSSYTSDLVVESVDENHGGYGVGWTPVTGECNTIDQCLGHGAPSEILGGDFGWRYYNDVDITLGQWHLFQFEFRESTVNLYDGTFRWWFDGKLIVDVDDVRTRTTTQPSSMRPHIVGWYNSHGTGADGNDHFYLDDVYIDNAISRIEIGDNAVYGLCTHREIQIPSAWSTTEITATVNRGSFGASDTAYLYVVDEDGVASDGYEITFGEEVGDITPPAISSLSPVGAQNCPSSPQTISRTWHTSEAADCRVDPAATTWAAMTPAESTGGTTHSDSASQACGASYALNILCQDAATNESDLATIEYSIDAYVAPAGAQAVFGAGGTGSVVMGAGGTGSMGVR